MRKLLLGVAAAAGLSTLSLGVLQAQSAPSELPGTMDPARVAAGTYQLDPAHSLVGWRVNHYGFNDYFGLFGDVSGTMTINPANVETAKLDVTVPLAGVTTANAALTAYLLRPGADGGKPDFFGANPAPARFVSNAVRRTGPTTAQITGDLTLNGVTQPVTVAAEFTGAGANPRSQVQTIGFEGRVQINRSDFGITFATPLVSEMVELELTTAFEKR